MVLLGACLVVISCMAILTCSWWLSSQSADKDFDSAVKRALGVFDQYSQAKLDLLKAAAMGLSSDPEFKRALASRNDHGIFRVLENYGELNNADLVLIVSRSGERIFNRPDSVRLSQRLTPVIDRLVTAEAKPQLVLIERSLLQTITLPINATGTIVYVIVGFEIDDNVALELQSLADLDVSFYQGAELLSSSLAASDMQISKVLNAYELKWMVWERPKYRNSSRMISTMAGGQTVTLVLSDSLDRYYLRFDRLTRITLALMGMIVALSILINLLLANKLTVALASIQAGIEQIANGNYRVNVRVGKACWEVQRLADAMESMGKEIQRREQGILYQAQHDLLTGLINRNTMLGEIDKRIIHQLPFYLIAIHVRDLQGINDNLGFQIGDACLQAVAKRLSRAFSSVPAVHGRIGGESFLSLIPSSDSSEALDDISALLNSLEAPLDFQAINLSLRFYMGVVFFPRDGKEGKDLVRRAMIAVENARKENVDIRHYKTGEDEAHLERIAIVGDLKKALDSDDGQLYMNYQPKQNLATGQIEKLEALIRWRRPGSGVVSPDIFIELAERAGLIIELTQWVLAAVLTQLQEWQDDGIDIAVAINISAQDLNHPDFLPRLQRLLKLKSIAASYITLELTERDLMTNEQQGVALMAQLRNAGFTLSVDDYGIGQSSLGKLKQLPVHELKIDKSFILKLDQSETDQMIVHSTIDLGHKLGLRVVAEGVENQLTLTILRQMKCDYIQGYYLAKPLFAHEVSRWLKEFDGAGKPT